MDRYDKLCLSQMPNFFLLLMSSAGLLKLGMMRLDDMPKIGAGLITFLFAFASLLYGRARAGVEQPEKALAAADEGFKACVIGSMGIAITSWIFTALAESYSPYLGNPLSLTPDNHAPLVPLIVAFVCVCFFGLPVFVKLQVAVSLTLESMAARKKFSPPTV